MHIKKITPAERRMFIRQLKRRDECSHAVFHVQDRHKATQGDILVWNTGKRNVHTEKIRIKCALFKGYPMKPVNGTGFLSLFQFFS